MATALQRARTKMRKLRSRYIWHRKKGHKAYRLRRAYQRSKLAYARLKKQDTSEFKPWMLRGHSGAISLACKKFIVRAVHGGLVVTSTRGGRHAKTSHHYSGNAVDVAGPWNKMVSFQKREASNPRRFRELFGPDNYANVKNGRRITLGEGTGLENQHDNHVHGAPAY